MAQYRVPHLHWMIHVVCAVILGFSLYGYLTQRESALAVLASTSSGNEARQTESGKRGRVATKPIVYNTFAIRNSTLFGSPELAGAEIVPEELPKTALSMELQGIFLYQDHAASTALILEDGEDIAGTMSKRLEGVRLATARGSVTARGLALCAG